MSAAAAALVAAAAAAAAVYVYHRGSNTPTFAGTIPQGGYVYDTLHPAVMAVVTGSASFAHYDPAIVGGCDFFVVDEPTGVDEGNPPKLPDAGALRRKPVMPIEVNASKCIVVDIRKCSYFVEASPAISATYQPPPPNPQRHSPARLRTPHHAHAHFCRRACCCWSCWWCCCT